MSFYLELTCEARYEGAGCHSSWASPAKRAGMHPGGWVWRPKQLAGFAKELKDSAKRAGWLFSKGDVICPACVSYWMG